MERRFIELLDKHHLKKTDARFSVLEVLARRGAATSQPFLEDLLGKDIDRVTLYRVLNTFEEKGIIHKIIDSRGTANYAVCSSFCTEHQHYDQHLHFNCNVCNNVYCMNQIHVPDMKLPPGFKMKTVNLIVTGICDRCS